MIPRTEFLCRSLQILLVTLLSACQGGTLPESSEGPVPTSLDGIERLHEVNDRLLTGSSPDQAGYRELQGMGVEIVLSVDGPMPPVELIRELGMRSVHLPIGYDGVPTEVIRSLVRLADEAPESTIYVHCHQGRHRGPAVAAMLLRLREQGSVEEGLAVLSACGTAPDYTGLWRSVEAFEVPEGLCRDASLPESVEPASLVRQMIVIQNLRDRLDSSGTTRVTEDVTLLLLRDAFVELNRLHQPPSSKTAGAWQEQLVTTVDLLESLRDGASFGARERALIDTRCDACHAASWE